MTTTAVSADPWEWRWAPYDEATYAAALAPIRPHDVVLDIGAGDLRFTRRLAARARFVYALERQATLVAQPESSLPLNCEVIIADARERPFPDDITAAVLLMRHCTHLRLYWEKLAAVGCRTLITNARWGLGVEVIDLTAPRRPFAALDVGWYACCCGGSGFIPGPPERLTAAVCDEEAVQEASDCPACRSSISTRPRK